MWTSNFVQNSVSRTRDRGFAEQPAPHPLHVWQLAWPRCGEPTATRPLADHVGTVRDLAEYDAQSGTTVVVSHRVYDAFGNLWSETAITQGGPSAAGVDFLFGFTGRPFDAATGLQNNLNRWYDPAVGRWLSEDPIGFNGDPNNLYRYVHNSPITFTDPSGLEEVELGWLSGLLDQLARDNPTNPLIAIPAGTLVGPSALLDGTVFRAIHASARESRRLIMNQIASSKDPIEKSMGVVVLSYGYVGEGFAMFGAAEGANAPIYAGMGVLIPPASVGGGLTHLTDSAGAAGIANSGQITGRQGIFAVPSSVANECTAMRVARTGLPPVRTGHSVPIPSNATGAFQPVTPLGPYSMWKALGGVQYAAPGSINTATGAFTPASSVIGPQSLIYGPDVAWYFGLGTGAIIGPPSNP